MSKMFMLKMFMSKIQKFKFAGLREVQICWIKEINFETENIVEKVFQHQTMMLIENSISCFQAHIYLSSNKNHILC